MKNPKTPLTQDAVSKPSLPQKPKTQKLVGLIVILILVIGIALVFGTYHKENGDATKITDQNNSLSSRIVSLNSKIKQQQNINNGVVSAGSIYKDPTGKIGLLNGVISMALPNGWKRLPASSCTGGSIDSNVTCEDVANVAPSDLIKSDGTASWSANIGVFDYSSSDGSAKSWYESKYFGSTLASFGTPEAVNISETPINGYSALSFQWAAIPPVDNPDYTNAVYVVVHGSYGVVVSAQVQASTVYGAANAFDYRTTYQPLISQMVQSIKFQD
jgi:hypothetical protein